MSDYEDIDYNKPVSPGIWKKMLPFIAPQKKLLIRTLFINFGVAAIDVAFPLILGYAIEHNIEPRSFDGVWGIMALAAGLMLIQALNVRLFVAMGVRAEMNIGVALRNAIFQHLQKLSLGYYNKTPVGYMMARTNSDTGRIGELVAWGMIDFSWSAFYCIGVVIAMFSVHWQLALIVCATVPPLALITWFFQRKILATNRIVRRINSKMTGSMNEGITGARTVKVLVNETQSLHEYKQITDEYRRNANHMAALRAVFIPLVLFIGSAATAVILAVGGHEIVYLGADLAVLAVFLQYAGGFFDPVNNIANILTDFISTQANVERVVGLLEHEPQIVDRPEVVAKYGDTFNPRPENWEPIKGDVEFRDVTFHYPDGKENILEHFNLHVAAGTYCAIVGETGAGKSTLVNLACRFFEPSEGAVLVDGVDYRERSQLWLHSALGYVLQTPHLFSGTIRENIRYGKLDATDAEVERAAEIVHADSIIAKLEQGYDTDVGEGGDRLSTGEKQLISFARAVLADPRIFVLDEATSSVDTEMEVLLQNAIQHLLSGRTSFVIAHRLSTIRNADIILVVHDGKIVERGGHSELMAKKGRYYDLYTRQFEEEAEEAVLEGKR